MLLTIGICDDCPAQSEIIISYIRSRPDQANFNIIQASEPTAFLAALASCAPQLVLLDVDMGPANGIQLGEQIKDHHPDVVIIYITAHENYAVDAFRLRAFNYLLKPLTQAAFTVALDEALTFLRQKEISLNEAYVSIRLKGEYVSMPYCHIICFEKVGHRIKIHTTTREILYYDNIHNLLTQLDASTFMQCHQGFIVNSNKIRSLRNKRLVLEKDIEIPVSRSHIEAVRQALERKLFIGRSQNESNR